MSHADQKNGVCHFCSEEIPVDDLREIDCGQPDITHVCDGCYEDIKSEYGIIGDGGYFSNEDY
jgi:hypothetical protein